MNYSYTAYAKTGKIETGIVQASSFADAKTRLAEKGLYAKSIKEASHADVAGVSARRERKVSARERALFTRRLATLVGSSVPLYDALTTLADQESNRSLRVVILDVRERILEGQSLAKALSGFPRVFGSEYCSMVAAGEASGSLAVILGRLADFQEGQDQIRRHTGNALVYPAIMSVVGVCVVVFLVSFVVPKISIVFAQNHGKLPLPTTVLLAVSATVRRWWFLFACLAGSAPFLYRRAMRAPKIRSACDLVLLRLPVVGEMVRNYILARFSRMLALLLSSGVPVVRAIDIAIAVVPNGCYREALMLSREAVVEGKALSSTLRDIRLFPPLLVHMASVGEKNGQLDAMLEKAGVAFEDDFRASVSRVVALIEPVIIMAMGIVVGFIVVAILLPIFNLNELIR